MTDQLNTETANAHETSDVILKLYENHNKTTTPLLKLAEWTTDVFAQPRFVIGILTIVILWIFYNIVAAQLNGRPFDPPPFAYLQTLVTILTVTMTCAILSTQRRDHIFDGYREQLTLELSIIAERKTAKIIALLEELRRDHPQIPDRDDEMAILMADTVDAALVIETIVNANDDSTTKTVTADLSENEDQEITSEP